MGLETITGDTGAARGSYALIVYDAQGREVPERDGSFSDAIVRRVTEEPITDVLLMSHGWNADLEGARDQYQRWLATMIDFAPGLAAYRGKVPEFRPLVVGLHWPSLAWADHEVGGDGSFGLFGGSSLGADTPAALGAEYTGAGSVDAVVEAYTSRLRDTPACRAAVRTIVESALKDVAPERLPADMQQAYEILDTETALGHGGVGGPPGDDRGPFDPERVYDQVMAEEDLVSFGSASLGGILAPLRVLSFWSMKRRACLFGESGAADLLDRLQAAVPAGRVVRFHLMGHSFGCIVASACITGRLGRPRTPVDSLTLVQGALSFWSFCESIPTRPDRPGYFHRLVADELVRGPMLVTTSEYDRAVGIFYPLGAGVAGQISYRPEEFPIYAGLGAFGARGPLPAVEDLRLRRTSEPYEFRKGTIYNLESSAIIAHGDGASGAHSDICHPELAHAVWSAMSATA